ncbi:hypothetical protein Ddc_18108 [Ditylenchus destructor]|nr:hypothetical protein Ddc_18108 [Ditylenchus destructor]
MIASSIEREKCLSATMTIFLTYHTISSAINFVNGVFYAMGPEVGLGVGITTSGGGLEYGKVFEFLRNLYVLLPEIVVLFVTLDRLLVLLLNMDYNKRARRIVVYSDLICLTLMALLVTLYQYYGYLENFSISLGVTFLHYGLYWKPRLIALHMLKALIGGMNAFNCFAFMYQLRKLPTLKVVS